MPVPDPFTQARQLEIKADEAYDMACETLGHNHEITVLLMMIMARSFALSCDIEAFILESHEPENSER